MTEGIEYMLAKENDFAQLAALRYQWRAAEEGERGAGEAEFEAQFRLWYEAHRATHLGYLAMSEETAIGCAWLFIVDRVPGPEKFIRRAGILQSVYVEPPRRNLGVGEGLIRRIVSDAKERELDYLMVHPSPASFSFYRRLGFAESGRVLELRFV